VPCFPFVLVPRIITERTNLSSAGVTRIGHKSSSVSGVLSDKPVSGSIDISGETGTVSDPSDVH
jgi:hypothetical protein